MLPKTVQMVPEAFVYLEIFPRHFLLGKNGIERRERREFGRIYRKSRRIRDDDLIGRDANT